MRSIVLIAHDIRSCHNVGSLLRTADGFGVEHVYLTGYTPYPPLPNGDTRLPHLASKIGRQIHKTALGAEASIAWTQQDDIVPLLDQLKAEGYVLAALEQDDDSISLPDFHAPTKIALLLGREVEGIEQELLKQVDVTLEIPMFGAKESFNVVQAAAAALYQLRFASEA